MNLQSGLDFFFGWEDQVRVQWCTNPRPGPDRTGPAAARATACDTGGVHTAPRAVSSGPWPRANRGGEHGKRPGVLFRAMPMITFSLFSPEVLRIIAIINI